MPHCSIDIVSHFTWRNISSRGRLVPLACLVCTAISACKHTAWHGRACCARLSAASHWSQGHYHTHFICTREVGLAVPGIAQLMRCPADSGFGLMTVLCCAAKLNRTLQQTVDTICNFFFLRRLFVRQRCLWMAPAAKLTRTSWRCGERGDTRRARRSMFLQHG